MDQTNKDSALYLSGLLARSFSRAFSTEAARIGFSPGQYPVLMELWKQDGTSQRALLDRLDIEQATLANTLARMERDGLIVRQRHPKDRRSTLIYLTERGRAMEAEALLALETAEAQMFRGFRRFEKELLKEYMRWAIANGVEG
ncbi:MarR family winged helix-turn-helix transcriptional regulator [Rhizobium alvei]|jgi:DNA-binding MarR family transcriptional regulator|uniref:MarR family transcriptional regulator n=1 Tax=Rhizobium alvei TaxID=1132659 RepID=A0ABT8YPP4_9HYPH|nr:MarR family transcriptional regulator [Rhizobium alvei]MDO6965496.1 MarR family transcriptional regulator [Rhizobium alvei]